MTLQRSTRRLTLPEPAATLWLTARDALEELLPETEWKKRLGGGTILAAHLGHRRSTDIDIVVAGDLPLTHFIDKIARRIGGQPTPTRFEDRIVITTPNGKLDINRVPLEDDVAQERARIAGRTQRILSMTQILKGKLDRATQRPRARDAYDIIRCSKDENARKELISAYGFVTDADRENIRNTLGTSNSFIEKDAIQGLELLEERVTGFNNLGTTAVETIESHDLQRVTVHFERGTIITRRTTRATGEIEDRCPAGNARRTWKDMGIARHLGDKGLGIERVANELDIYRARHAHGLIVDTSRADEHENLSRLNSPKP